MKENPFSAQESTAENIYKSDPTPDLENAVNSGNAEELFNILAKIDRTLTQAHSGTFAKHPDASVADVKKEIQTFLAEYPENPTSASIKVYLGDGGYSRLILRGGHDGKFKAEISPASSDRVKNKWLELTS